jgi:transcriptional regulator GlxA family with amidase domain
MRRGDRQRGEQQKQQHVRVHILVMRNCTPIVPIGTIDLLRKSIALATTLPGAQKRTQTLKIDLTLVAAHSQADDLQVECAGGVRLICDKTLRTAGKCDIAIVGALDPDVVESLALNKAAVEWVRRVYEEGGDVASACTGSFVLAEAGLLDKRVATTHWAFQDQFIARYPSVRMMPAAVIVDQGRIVTAGGATAFVNLVLLLVERLLGQDVAWAASKMFLIDPNKSPQSAYAAFSTQKDHGDPPILRAQELIEAEVKKGPSVEELAKRVALSRRTFVRRFQSATGNTPRDYIHRVRIEVAKRALERGDAVMSVAMSIGYDDAVAFRKIFVRLTGLTPADYRARYGPRAAPAFESFAPNANASAKARARA